MTGKAALARYGGLLEGLAAVDKIGRASCRERVF